MPRFGHVTFMRCPIIMKETANVLEACSRMRDDKAGSVLVTNDAGELVGIFTGRDAVCRVLAHSRDAATTPLASVMTTNPIAMSPAQTTGDALHLMWNGGFRHLPLVKNGRILGLLSRGDFKGVEQRPLEEERDLWEHLR